MKKDELIKYISKLVTKGVAVCFSGGVDSALVLRIAGEEARKQNAKILALTFQTNLTPEEDLSFSKNLAKEFGVKQKILYIDLADNKKIINNDPKRCYYCKYQIFEKAKEFAKENGLSYVLDGTNFDDSKVYRPGLKALDQLGIISPLRKFHFTKQEVRKLARELDISVSDRPSAPCLATRFPYRSKIHFEDFGKIQKGEAYLTDKGYSPNRIRMYGDCTRIEIPKEKIPDFVADREVVDQLKSFGFTYINLDLEGFRSGSMDEVVNGR